MTGLEHKDERLHVTEQADWRDKLADLRRNLSGDLEADDESERTDDAAIDQR